MPAFKREHVFLSNVNIPLGTLLIWNSRNVRQGTMYRLLVNRIHDNEHPFGDVYVFLEVDVCVRPNGVHDVESIEVVSLWNPLFAPEMKVVFPGSTNELILGDIDGR